MRPLGQGEYYLLGVLITEVDEHIGTFWSFQELARPSFSIDQAKAALSALEEHQLARFSTVSMPGTRRKADPMIQLTSRGLAFCLLHEADIIKAAMDGDMSQLVAVREAYDRLRISGTGLIDSTLWTGLSKKIDADTGVKIRAGIQTLIEVIKQSDLNLTERADALAYASAVRELVEAPDPPWKIVVDLLTSKQLSAFLNAAAVLTIIFQVLN